MRKIYLDNIRWCIIILVVFFHVFFFFNNIGITAIFEGLPEYHQGDGMTFAGVYQYAVYPWFMTLLFVVAGVAAYHTLQLSRQAMYCTIPINVRLMQSMFRCFLKLPGKERFRFRQTDWKRKKKHRMLRHRLQPMHCFIMENTLRMSR